MALGIGDIRTEESICSRLIDLQSRCADSW